MLLKSILRGRQCVHSGLRRMASNTVKVEVQQGVVVGQARRLPNGVPFHCFQGVPYAVPPLGNLRFKSPLPLQRFETPELDCTTEREVSHQRDPLTSNIVGSENCLFLNVYVPQTQKRKPLPVMVWIHGGAYFFGSGNSNYYYPLSLMEEEVIVVTLNYRLGALGFLCLPEAGIWGNAGLKDQRLALQWVHDNIQHFNGDANNVTLFGESAGASAVHMHAYAEHANKLFHKVIMQSGTANTEWAFQSNPIYKAYRLIELLGCKSRNTSEIVEFLASDKVTPLAILANTMAVLTADERRRGLPLVFKPVIEETDSPDIFIKMPIMESLQQPNQLTMPTIMGYNSSEGIGFMVNAIRKLKDIDQDFERLVPRNIPLLPGDADLQDITKQVRKFYFGENTLGPEQYDALAAVLSDYHFTVDMQRAAELQVQHQPNAPLYFYRFNYTGGRNIYQRIFQLQHLHGVCHGDELFYLFQMAEDEAPQNADDARFIKQFSQLWTNFARYSNPTPSRSSEVNWSPVQRPANEDDNFVLDFLHIDKNCEMRRNPEGDRIEFWRNIYRTYTPTDYSQLSLAKL